MLQQLSVRTLYLVAGIVIGLTITGCGERVDYKYFSSNTTCAIAEVTDTVIRIQCTDGTTLELPAPPPETVEVEVEVPIIIEIPEECEDTKIPICHKGKTLELPLAAIDAHLGHGDALGACPVIPPPCEGDDCPPPCEGDDCPCVGDDCGGPVTVTLCHKPGTPAEMTKDVPAAAVPGHLGHGDFLGPCEE